MKFRTDMNKVMEHIQIDDEMKNEILDETTRLASHKHRAKFTGKKAAVVVIAGILCLSSIAVGGGEISKLWDQTVAKLYKVNEKTQRELVDKGYVNIVENEEAISDTQNGVTVFVRQTIADKYGLYVYFQVKSTNGHKLSGEDKIFAECDIMIDNDGSSISSYYFIDDEYSKSEYEAGFMAAYIKLGEEIVGKEAKVCLKDLKTEDGVIQGEWNLSWTVKGMADMKAIPLHDSWKYNYEVEGRTERSIVYFNCFEISPFSFCLEYQLDELGESNELISALPIQVVMEDGTCYSDLPAYSMERGEKRYIIKCFNEPIDLNEVKYVEIAGEKYDMK